MFRFKAKFYVIRECVCIYVLCTYVCVCIYVCMYVQYVFVYVRQIIHLLIVWQFFVTFSINS